MAYAEYRTANRKPFNERTLIGRNLVGMFKKREKYRINQEIKSVHIGYQINRSGIKLFNPKNPSSEQRIGVFATNSNFPISISLQPDGVKLGYFTLRF